MFARLTIVQVKTDKVDEVIKIYGDKVVPAAKSQKGYKGNLIPHFSESVRMCR